ncbi:hypothetical protein [Sphingomonas sp. Leaf4]|uniref:hypothetical protein n=1 Tax=Sphingomonas sp. Leaf4 TaxID=2876553 RepID=UPI001E435345|nr:hypothetical protein [Sphingomonas sp. Leaf4]
MTAAQGDLRVDRWAPARFEIPCIGFDFTDQPLTMQVRQYRDAPGEPLINLATNNAPAEGLSLTVDRSGTLPVTTISIRINETTLEDVLPFPVSGVAPGADVVLVYALHVGTGAAKMRFLEGNFTLVPGANAA